MSLFPGKWTQDKSIICQWLALAFWLWSASCLHAQVRPASHPLYNARLERIVALIPGSPLDLPPFLAKSKDVYLLVTAGAAYTDIQVLANPTLPPQKIALALESALEKTSLHSSPVEWSADRYSAAQVSVRHSRIGTMQTSSTLPLGALVAGLQKSGLTPHLLLRIPGYATTGALPRSHYGTRSFRWYDARRIGGRGSITVTARIAGVGAATVLGYCLLVPGMGTLGLVLAPLLSRRRPAVAQRYTFRSTGSFFVTGAFLLQTLGMVYLLRTPTPSLIADLWFGSGTTTFLVPFFVVGAVWIPVFVRLAHRQEVRRFGPVPVIDPIPMPEEEKIARKRVAQYAALPHLIGGVPLIVLPFLVTRHSPLYPYIHPLAIALPAVGGALIGRVFQKRLSKFTQKTEDADLTWRARQMGQKLNVRMPNVFVEDSSRAAHLAFATRQRHDITVSRKLQTTFSPAEMDFVLAQHLAGMRLSSSLGKQLWLVLLPLSIFLPAVFVLLPGILPGVPSLSSFILSAWFLPSVIAYAVLIALLPLALSRRVVRQQARQEAEADRAALEATGDFPAADSAMEKLTVDGLLLSASSVKTGQTAELLKSTRMLQRRKDLRQSAQVLNLVPASAAQPATQSGA